MTMSHVSTAIRPVEPIERTCPLPTVIDCTVLPRFGVRGRGSCLWLETQGFPVPDAVNVAKITDNGILVLRLGQDEAMISCSGAGKSIVNEIETRWAAATGAKGYDAFRRDGWAHLAIAGAGARELMSEITEIDLRPSSMPVGRISQSRALHMDAVIVRTDRFGEGGYELFFDIASRSYAMEALRGLEPDLAFLSADEFFTGRMAAVG